jgi:hypothetical protein
MEGSGWRTLQNKTASNLTKRNYLSRNDKCIIYQHLLIYVEAEINNIYSSNDLQYIVSDSEHSISEAWKQFSLITVNPNLYLQ